ncbi:hypothetical protein ACS0TY_001350 [Phlomoides rotata]
MKIPTGSGRPPLIFNFEDSNSDTRGLSAGTGLDINYPYGRAFFHPPSGRAADGRLLIDFLCEHLDTHYLSPYLDSLAISQMESTSQLLQGHSLVGSWVADCYKDTRSSPGSRSVGVLFLIYGG